MLMVVVLVMNVECEYKTDIVMMCYVYTET